MTKSAFSAPLSRLVPSVDFPRGQRGGLPCEPPEIERENVADTYSIGLYGRLGTCARPPATSSLSRAGGRAELKNSLANMAPSHESPSEYETSGTQAQGSSYVSFATSVSYSLK